MPTSQGRIPLPRLPQAPSASPFPIFAFVAPIVAAAFMWAFTHSPFVLVFAVLGPVIALATMGDSRRRARADLRQQRVRFEQDIEGTIRAIDEAHDREREDLNRKVSRSSALVSTGVRDSERWRGTVADGLIVRLGTGRITSRVVLDDAPAVTTDVHEDSSDARSLNGLQRRSLDELRERARALDVAPVVTDAALGIGVCGSRAEATAVATSIAIQLAAALSPLDVNLKVSSDAGGVFSWALLLPHNSTGPSADPKPQSGRFDSGNMVQLSFTPRAGGSTVILCVAEDEHALPRECRVVVSAVGSRARIVRHPASEVTNDFVPDYISHRQAQRFAATLQQAAHGSFEHWGHELPERVALRQLLEAGEYGSPSLRDGDDTRVRGSRDSLVATVGIGAGGPVCVDLVTEGPHAIVGGTTGSGKSEVLVTWVLAIAAGYRPRDVNFLLIDFKGGAAFAPVQDLPHTVGVLTDLDPVAARRAILSLKAELQRRERVLADAKVRSIAELPHDIELPRLLIIVDEFAAMTASFTEMNDLFSDLAARGRSLGIHLILCTQRPSGTIRDAVLANCSLRVSLRVNNAADSSAVVGTPDASRILKHLPGRSLLVRGTADVESVQWAMASDEDAREISALPGGGSAPIQRPWLDPLPHILDVAAVSRVPGPAMAFGLTDIPEEQRQAPAIYDPVSDGSLFIVGGHRSGKSTVLATFANLASDVVTVPSNAEGAWDTVAETLALVRRGAGPSLVTLDDLDLVVGMFGQEHETAFLDRVTSLVREGPRAGTATVITASALKARVQAVAALCSSTLVLRMRDRQEHVLVGGEAAEFSPQLPPGGGFWRGHRVQVCFSVPVPHAEASEVSPIESSLADITVVISARPEALRSRLEPLGQVTALDTWRARSNEASGLEIDRGSPPTFILGDPDAWLSSSVLLGSLRSRCLLVFHDCSLTEFRTFARIRELPPPLNTPHDTVVVVHPDGRLHRARLPA